MASRPPAAQGEARNRFSSEPPERTNPTDTWISDFQPPALGDNTFLWSQPPGLWYIGTATPESSHKGYFENQVYQPRAQELTMYASQTWKQLDK